MIVKTLENWRNRPTEAILTGLFSKTVSDKPIFNFLFYSIYNNDLSAFFPIIYQNDAEDPGRKPGGESVPAVGWQQGRTGGSQYI